MRENGLRAPEASFQTNHGQYARLAGRPICWTKTSRQRRDQKWSADISYISAEGWLYLAVLVDLFSRRVVGWAVSDRLKKDLACVPCVWRLSRDTRPVV